jgi:hypothetical protein
MVYLYAGLGIAMLSGIMTIFEMGLAVTGQSLLRSPEESYFNDIAAKNIDKNFMKSLYDGKWEKEFVDADPAVSISCSNLLPIDEYSWARVERGFFEGSCAANSPSHRILVKLGSEVMSYRIYTCSIKSDDGQCSFEQES